MAIVFVQQKNSQKNLILVLIGVLLFTAFVLYQGFFKKSPAESLSEQTLLSSQIREIKIDFNVLKNPLLENLQPFAEIAPLEVSTSTKYGKVGRENPFLPY
jgi:hypothetical protein